MTEIPPCEYLNLLQIFKIANMLYFVSSFHHVLCYLHNVYYYAICIVWIMLFSLVGPNINIWLCNHKILTFSYTCYMFKMSDVTKKEENY